MQLGFELGFGALLFALYWYLLAKLVDAILDGPRLKPRHWLLIGLFNLAVVSSVFFLLGSLLLTYFAMMLLMLLEFTFFYRDSFSGATLCTLACSLHVLSIFMLVLTCSATFHALPPLALISNPNSLLMIFILVFFILDAAILAVLKCVPLPMVKLINQHKEQQWFIISWMLVNALFLLYTARTLYNESFTSQQLGTQIITALVSLTSLYIVLFFSIKTSSILGYRDKNLELEQTIQREQQYRNSMLRDALASYEINVTQDTMLRGFESHHDALGDMIYCYTEMLAFMSRRLIYSEDVADFMRTHGRSNILRLFDLGESEIVSEYRRLLDSGAYIWVRSIVNLVQDLESGDTKAFIYIKNIDTEKRTQLELQHKAERDPLTGLYNKSMTGKLVDEHLIFSQSNADSALFMIDVDNFKDINDHLGHLYGDAVLCELADKLMGIFRSNDIVGRIGGDEYIVFLKDGATEQSVADKANEIQNAFHSTYQGASGEKYTISSSIGIAFYPRDGESFRMLYSHADVALYAAKGAGKDGYQFYDGSSFLGYESQRTEIQSVGNVSQKGFRKNRIEYVFKMLYESETPVAAIRAVLELVARHFSFERGYIFETSSDGKTTNNTFEWCAEGVTPEIANLQNLPLASVATANASFHVNGTFVLKSLDDISPFERGVLEPQGIKSMFQFGIFDKSRLLGFIGFDNCRTEEVPSDSEIDEMKTICNILATFFVKQYIDEVAAKDLLVRQDVMNQLSNYIYVINIETFELLFMNKKVQQLLAESTNGARCYQFFRGESAQCADCPLHSLARGQGDRAVSEIYNEKLGLWMETAASFLRWTDGSLACLVNCTDISHQKEEHLRHIKQLENLAYVDVLTGSRSYHKFKEDARRILEKQPDSLHLLVKLDIDNFKLINQMYGFERGDEVLCALARTLEACARNQNEIFARVGNDEFIALFEIANKAEADHLFEGFLARFQTFVGDDFVFKCHFPHGRYLMTPKDIQELDLKSMFEKVNIAHKVAKLNKARSFVYYDEDMTREALRAKEVENKMGRALEQNEFIIYLQPKYHLKGETIGGAEALTRWQNTNEDLFFPSAFISIFERNGFIIKLDFYVFEQVCSILRTWIDAGLEPIPISVNFSRLHLENPDFVKDLCEIVDRIGVDRSLLEIEITETVIYDHIETLEVLLGELHTSGFTMSMDDFGSGYSSLGFLKSLAVDVIKMDRSFFANQRDEARTRTVVGSMIQMAAGLGIRIVAEGVEEKTHIDFLRELGCDMVQGYYYAKPMPVDEFTKLLAR